MPISPDTDNTSFPYRILNLHSAFLLQLITSLSLVWSQASLNPGNLICGFLPFSFSIVKKVYQFSILYKILSVQHRYFLFPFPALQLLRNSLNVNFFFFLKCVYISRNIQVVIVFSNEFKRCQTTVFRNFLSFSIS